MNKIFLEIATYLYENDDIKLIELKKQFEIGMIELNKILRSNPEDQLKHIETNNREELKKYHQLLIEICRKIINKCYSIINKLTPIKIQIVLLDYENKIIKNPQIKSLIQQYAKLEGLYFNKQLKLEVLGKHPIDDFLEQLEKNKEYEQLGNDINNLLKQKNEMKEKIK